MPKHFPEDYLCGLHGWWDWVFLLGVLDAFHDVPAEGTNYVW